MQYRKFGKTGFATSVLGFGAMRLPMIDKTTVDRDRAVPLLLRAYELGVNYFDTGKWYCGGDSERALGEAIKSKRADACTECGTCEDQCPQIIPIMQQLKECQRVLGRDI